MANEDHLDLSNKPENPNSTETVMISPSTLLPHERKRKHSKSKKIRDSDSSPLKNMILTWREKI